MSERQKHEVAIDLSEIDAVERVDTDRDSLEVVMMDTVVSNEKISADVYDSIMAIIEPTDFVPDGTFDREHFERHVKPPRKGEIVLRFALSRF